MPAAIPRLRVITNERNMNIGPSFKRALAAARKEFVFWQTVDWSYDLTHLRLFLEAGAGDKLVLPLPCRGRAAGPAISIKEPVCYRSDHLRAA